MRCLHWWILVHFLFHNNNGFYRSNCLELIRLGGTVDQIERLIGPVDRVEKEWYAYTKSLKAEYGLR